MLTERILLIDTVVITTKSAENSQNGYLGFLTIFKEPGEFS